MTQPVPRSCTRCCRPDRPPTPACPRPLSARPEPERDRGPPMRPRPRLACGCAAWLPVSLSPLCHDCGGLRWLFVRRQVVPWLLGRGRRASSVLLWLLGRSRRKSGRVWLSGCQSDSSPSLAAVIGSALRLPAPLETLTRLLFWALWFLELGCSLLRCLKGLQLGTADLAGGTGPRS